MRAVRHDGNGRFRRIFLAAASSGEGLLIEGRTAAQPWRRELALMPPFLPLPPRSRLSRSDFAKRGSDSRQAYAKQHEDLYAESAYKAARDIDAEFVNNDQNNRRAQEDLKRDETAMNTLHRGE